MRKLVVLLLLSVTFLSNSLIACNGFTPAVTTNTYIGNGEYLLSIEICEFVSNSDGLGDFAAVNGLLITVNGANIINWVTPSITGTTSGLTVFPNIIGPNQIEYGDWGNSAAPVLLAYGDPQECWTIEIIVDNSAATVDVWGSSSESVFQPGFGMVQNGGIWGCGSGLGVPPAICDASWTVPSLCEGSTTPIDLDTMSIGSGTYSGPGVNSATGIFNPTGLSGTVTISYLIGDAFFNCTVTQDIVFETVATPILTDTTICIGDVAPLDANVGAPPPPPPPAVSPCNYSITLWDTWGDGWNGGNVTILVGGVPVQSNVTLVSGSGPVSYNFDVMPGDAITVNYIGGSFTSENYYSVYNGSNGTGSSIFNSLVGWTPNASQAVTNPCTGGVPAVPTDCTYDLFLDESYGDGWQGGDVDIYINGVLYLANQAVPNCGGLPCNMNIPIPVNDGDVILLNYSGGIFDNENTIYLYDSQGVLINSINNPPDGNLGAGIAANCPATSMDYVWSPAGSLSDPNIANPIASPGASTVYSVTVTSPNSGCSSTTNVAVTVNNCALPIELNYFNGSCYENDVSLVWRTLSEFNNEYFEVQYSVNGFDYEKIGSVDGKGYSNELQQYSFRLTGQQEIVGYYSLIQVDIDGTRKTSDAIAVQCVDNDITAYVAKGTIIISSFLSIENVRVLDMTGRVVFEGKSDHIDISKNGFGMYFLEVQTTESFQRLKVLNANN